MRFNTSLLHAGVTKETNGSTLPPVYQTSAFEQESAADLEKIFERFYRSEQARQQTQQGSGLGLAICRAIVERFGGTLTIKDTALDIGSTFRVTLPLLSEN